MLHHIDCQFINMEKSVTCFFTEKQNHLSQLEMPPKPGIDLFLSLSFSCWCVHYSRNIKKRFRITQNRLKLKSQCWKAEEFSLLSPVFGNVSRDFFDGKSIRLIPLDNRFHDIRSKIVQRKNS